MQMRSAELSSTVYDLCSLVVRQFAYALDFHFKIEERAAWLLQIEGSHQTSKSCKKMMWFLMSLADRTNKAPILPVSRADSVSTLAGLGAFLHALFENVCCDCVWHNLLIIMAVWAECDWKLSKGTVFECQTWLVFSSRQSGCLFVFPIRTESLLFTEWHWEFFFSFFCSGQHIWTFGEPEWKPV